RVGEAVRRADHEEVEGVLRVQVPDPTRLLFASAAPGRRRALGRRPGFDGDLDTPSLTRRVADGGADQTAEMGLDPLSREVVRHADDERFVGELAGPRFAEPVLVGRVVE